MIDLTMLYTALNCIFASSEPLFPLSLPEYLSNGVRGSPATAILR